MINSQNSAFSGKFSTRSFLLTAAFSLSVIAATFLISNSHLSFENKTVIFGLIAAVYMILCAAFYFWQRKAISDFQTKQTISAFNDEIEGKLFALEEANEYFGASLKFSDMFRLVTSRVNEIVPFAAGVMFLRGTGGNILETKYAVGENSREFMNFKADTNKGLAVKSLMSGKIRFDEDLSVENRVFPAAMLASFRAAAAIPLTNRGEVYGVLVLYGASESSFGANSEAHLSAVAERISPLFANSFAFEKSVSNALTDSLTSLPNERGFFMVLENQLAESMRYRDERPLTVLALDIRNFAEINQKHGHATGDKLLAFAAGIIKKQLRQMDVLTRTAGDEFLAILPTANEKISAEIVRRIERAFVLNSFRISERETTNLAINFGAATFWRDGETSNELLKIALLRKQQDKSAEKSKVIWFPREFVN